LQWQACKCSWRNNTWFKHYMASKNMLAFANAYSWLCTAFQTFEPSMVYQTLWATPDLVRVTQMTAHLRPIMSERLVL
jgi:hypothetical protein